MKNKLQKVRRAVAGDMLAQEIPALLSRDGFVARYLPEYVQPYELPSGIRIGLNGRPLARGNRSAQVSKRENIISAAFAIYAETRQAQIDFDAKCRAARTANNQV